MAWIVEQIVSDFEWYDNEYTTVAPGWEPNTVLVGRSSGPNLGIKKFDLDGNLLVEFGSLYDPETVIFNPYDGNVYVQTNTTAGIFRYDPDTGTFTHLAYNSSARVYSGSARPSDGHLWGSFWTNYVTEYDLAGTLIGTYYFPQGDGSGGTIAYYPEFVQCTWAPDGNLYLADYWGGVIRYEPSTGTWSYPIFHCDQLLPANTGRVQAVTFANGRLYFISSTGTAPTLLSCLLDGSDAKIETVIDDDPADGFGDVCGMTAVGGSLFAVVYSGGPEGGVWKFTEEGAGCTLELGSRVLCMPFANGNDYAIALNCPEAAADLSVGQRVLCTPIHGGNDYAIQS